MCITASVKEANPGSAIVSTLALLSILVIDWESEAAPGTICFHPRIMRGITL